MKVKVSVCKEIEIDVADRFEKLNVDINDEFCYSSEAHEMREELIKEVERITGYEPMADTWEKIKASTANEYFCYVEKVGGYPLIEF